MKLEQAKKVNLGIFPTPLQWMENLTKEIGFGDLYVKRDDLTDVGLSGNKIRKLEYLIYDAKEKGCNTLLTFGGPQTNHGRLTVAAAAKCGMKSILILNGKRPDYCSGNLVLDELMGADIYFCSENYTNEEVDRLVATVIAKYEAQGDKVYSIPVGGSNEVGAVGYIQMVPEMLKQMEEQNISSKHLVCGAGSLGTFGGLWLGAKYYKAPFEVIGVCISPTARPLEYAVDYINGISEYYEMGITCRAEDLHIIFDEQGQHYAGLGYNIPDKTTRDYMRLMARNEAIILDPCYTGKVFHGYIDMIRSGFIPKGDSAIFLHTGGFPAIWSQEHLDAVQEELWSEDIAPNL